MKYPISPPATNSNSSASWEKDRIAKRRRVHNSSLSGSELNARLDVPNYFLERWRVGVPGLQQLPLTEDRAKDHPIASAKIRQLEECICQLLRDQGVYFDKYGIELVHRAIPNEPKSEDDLTLLIEASWESDADAQPWLNAASAIKELLVASSSATRNVKVELWSWQLRALRTIDVVEISHPLVAIWKEDIKPRILSILDSTETLRNGWTSVDVLRMGYFIDHDFGGTQTPSPVTVSITVEYGLIRKDWIKAQDQIRAVLDIKGLQEVEIEFERGDGVFGLTFDLPAIGDSEDFSDHTKEDYPERVSMGADFGPEKYFPGSNGEVAAGPKATIGGYIEIRRNHGDWKKYMPSQIIIVSGRQSTVGVRFSTIKATRSKSRCLLLVIFMQSIERVSVLVILVVKKSLSNLRPGVPTDFRCSGMTMRSNGRKQKWQLRVSQNLTKNVASWSSRITGNAELERSSSSIMARKNWDICSCVPVSRRGRQITIGLTSQS